MNLEFSTRKNSLIIDQAKVFHIKNIILRTGSKENF